jgi:prepilin-type processing-associated H-X9-DG protein
VKSDALFKVVDEKLTQAEVPHTKVEEDGVNMRMIQLPAAAPFKVMPTIAMFDSYLVIASSDDLVMDIVNTSRGKTPGLKASPEFAAWSRDLPTQGNSFLLITPTLTRTIVDMQTAAFDKLAKEDPEGAALVPMMNAIWSTDVFYLYQVGVHDADGLLTVSNGNKSGASMLANQFMVVPVAIGAGMLLPVLSKARTKARRVNSAGNMKQLGLAMLMYSGDNGGRFPTPDGAAGLNVLHVEDFLDAGKVYINPRDNRPTPVDGITEATTSYAYIGGGLKDDNDLATSMPILVEKPTGDPWINVLFIDGHVEGFRFEGETIEGIIDMLDDRFDYDKDVYQMLIDKAQKLDRVIMGE